MSINCEKRSEFLPQLDGPLPGTDFCYLDEFTGAILSPNEAIRALQKAAFCTPREVGESTGTVDCPVIDSLHAQLFSLCQKDGVLDREKLISLVHRIDKCGVMFYADGTKVQLVTTLKDKGKSCGDRYVATNLEILICAAKKMNCDLVTSIYSGDENVGVLLVPRDPDQYQKSAQKVQEVFAQTCKELSDATYRNKEHPQAALFQEMQAAINAGTLPDEKHHLGFTLETEPIHDVNTHLPPQHSYLRLNALAAAILDLACKKIPVESKSQGLLIEQMFSAIISDVEKTSPINPSSIHSAYLEQLYQKAILAGLSRKYASELLNRAIFESTFPRQMQVRKKTQLENDIREGVMAGKTYHLVDLANTQIKYANGISHTHGDNEIIAGINIIQRYLSKQLGKDAVHEGIMYYKSEGSNLILVEDRVWDKVKPLLADPLAINTYIHDQETIRRKKAPKYLEESLNYRANPFIVTTISNLVINSDTSVEQIWHEIDYELRPKQLARERAYTILATFSATTQLDLLIRNISKIIDEPSRAQLGNMRRNSKDYTTFGKNYLLGRQNNHDISTLLLLLQDEDLVKNLLYLLSGVSLH
jgi:hypothetical protein